MISKGPLKRKLFCDSVIHDTSPQRKRKYDSHSACKQQNCSLNTQRSNTFPQDQSCHYLWCIRVSHNEWQHKLNLILLNDETKNTELAVLLISIVN